MKNLASILRSASAHSTLTSSNGVVTCGEVFHTPVEEIKKDLENQGMTNVRRITIRRDGKLLYTKHLILTFRLSKLPECIKAGYMRLATRPYIPNPLRCFKCQRFGQSEVSCRGTVTCARCRENGHESSEFTRQEKCTSSNTSFSRSCPSWQFERKIVKEKLIIGISHTEAKKAVRARLPTSGLTYVAATKSTQFIPIILDSDFRSFQNSHTPTEMCLKSAEAFIMYLHSIKVQKILFQNVKLLPLHKPYLNSELVRNRKKLKN
ncbi:uncharacterized protein LOC129975419 [Argiope bruennichi]|uniref:uncharacterized protein LOC129975419 n=1 Tax=Argiope bruennichi TaxID=94029 RepID=UPI0024951364|nr:uncharacterized protein LOC129975419 [Argiope bruennichi]